MSDPSSRAQQGIAPRIGRHQLTTALIVYMCALNAGCEACACRTCEPLLLFALCLALSETPVGVGLGTSAPVRCFSYRQPSTAATS